MLLSTAGAITSKEHGFMLPVILALQEGYYFLTWKNYSWSEKSKWTGIGSVTLVAILIFFYRNSITGPRVPHELWTGVSTLDRMATSIRIYAEYMGMHLFPWKLIADYWSGEAPISTWLDWKVWLAILVIGAVKLLAIRKRKPWPVVTWGIFYFLLVLLPVSNFLFAVGFVKAERILYIPGIGLIIAMAALLVKGIQFGKTKWPAILLLGVMTIFFVTRTWERTYDWKDNFALAQATLKNAPDSPRMNNMMGLALQDQQKNTEALAYFEKAVHYNPNHVPALVNLGTQYRNFNRLPEAAATLEKALALDPNTLATYVNLMSVYRSMEDYDKNLAIADKAMAKFPDSAPVVWNAANAYQLKGNMEKANELRDRARQIDPGIGGE
ncbi:MAG TPA: tetratricopeptide repeat protein, partial [Saprospiraceae bacterium]|nr:tetratricopeptide repeat protein [Saprospiraceae bacterium]